MGSFSRFLFFSFLFFSFSLFPFLFSPFSFLFSCFPFSLLFALFSFLFSLFSFLSLSLSLSLSLFGTITSIAFAAYSGSGLCQRLACLRQRDAKFVAVANAEANR